MFFLPWNALKARLREAENARRNWAEIVAARSRGQVSRRDLIKQGLITVGALLLAMGSASAYVQTETASRDRRAPVDKARPATWRTRTRIIGK